MEAYTFLRLSEGISSVDCVVLPLFDKEGMPELAREITAAINSLPHARAEMDSSKSIGRRYARADEIGIPWANCRPYLYRRRECNNQEGEMTNYKFESLPMKFYRD